MRDDGYWLASDGNWYPPWEHPARPWWRSKRLAVAAVVVIAAGAGAMALSRADSDDDPQTAPTAEPQQRPIDEGEANAEPELVVLTYDKGDCVTWPVDSRDVQTPDIVDCDETHRFEVTGSITVAGDADDYPSEAEWSAITDERCRPHNEEYLGGPLDPFGRVVPYNLLPDPEGWRLGDRTAWCGLRLDLPKGAAPYEGSVRDVEQEVVHPSGTCLVEGSWHPVPCDQPHTFEVSGSTRLPDGITPPADVDAWQELVGAECERLGAEHLGGPLPLDLATGWMTLAPESYAAGSRSVTCVIGRPDGSGYATVTGSLGTP